MKRGFTLVELSIVLVIIGLLIGGILVAQSMISTSKITRFINNIGQYDAAVANFQTKYNGVPGDTSSVNGLGNNDGNIDCKATNPPNCQWDNEEISRFWEDLSLTGFLNAGSSGYTHVFSAANFAGTNVPKSALGTNLSVVAYNPGSGSPNTYYIGKVTAATGTGSPVPVRDLSLAYYDVMSVNQKLDDGNPWTGRISLIFSGGTPGTNVNQCSGLNGFTAMGCGMTIQFGIMAPSN